MNGEIKLPTCGGHPRWWTWPHGLTLSTAAPAGEREEGEKGNKEEEERDEVAADRWGRVVSGMGVGCAGRRALLRVGGPKAKVGQNRGCGPRQGVKGFPIKPSPIFYSNLNSNSNFQLLTLAFISPNVHGLIQLKV
jgi:hypothetical protein